MASTSSELEIAKDAVLVKSEKLPDVTPVVKGYEWNNGIDYDQLLGSYVHSGFQATNLGKAIEEVNKMVGPNDKTFSPTFQNAVLMITFSVRLSSNSNTKRRCGFL